MSERILIADDDQRINELLQEIYEMEGYEVLSAEDGEKALAILEKEAVDLLILDVMMPELDGWEVLDYVKRQYDTKILMLTALSDEYSEVRGLRLGADDYVTKPFKRAVLLERSRKLLGERRKALGQDLIWNGLKVCQAERKVYVDENEAKLTTKEFQLLQLLMQNAGIVLQREVILEKIWGMAYEKNDRTIDTHIKMLRRSIGMYGSCIRTIRGVGYSFDGEVEIQ